jgi:hypothetical protein
VAPRELFEDSAQRDAARGEEDHAVEPEIGHLRHDAPVATSVASSPIFRQICASPRSKSDAV